MHLTVQGLTSSKRTEQTRQGTPLQQRQKEQSKMATSQTLIEQVTGNTPVQINISGASSDGKKITVDEITSVQGLGVNTNVGAAPKYPGTELGFLEVREDLSPEQKEAERKRLLDAFKRAQTQHAAGGGVSLQNRIAKAVVKKCSEEYNMSEKGGKAWNLNEGNLTVTVLERDGTVMVRVSGAPVWGQAA